MANKTLMLKLTSISTRQHLIYDLNLHFSQNIASSKATLSIPSFKNLIVIITMDEKTKRVTQSFVTRVSPSRMFRALILDSHNICPKLLFSSIKSVEFFEGDGDVGTIKQVNYIEDGEIRYTKHRVDVLDKEKFMCKYKFIEGDGFVDNMLEFLTHEVKFEGYGQGGCVCRITTEFKAKEGVEIKGIDIELGKYKPLGMYEVVEAHLKAYPQLYA